MKNPWVSSSPAKLPGLWQALKGGGLKFWSGCGLGYYIRSCRRTSFTHPLTATLATLHEKNHTYPRCLILILPPHNLSSLTNLSKPIALAISTMPHVSSRGTLRISGSPRSPNCLTRQRKNILIRSDQCLRDWPSLMYVPGIRDPPLSSMTEIQHS